MSDEIREMPLCFYCDMPIACELERDHAPVPARLGGEHTVPACLNCHDLKDRIHARNWDVELQLRALKECGPLGRIYLAKAFAVYGDKQYLADSA